MREELIDRIVRILDARNTPKPTYPTTDTEQAGYLSFLRETARGVLDISLGEVVEEHRSFEDVLRVGFDPIEREARYQVLLSDARRAGLNRRDWAGWARIKLVQEAYEAGQRRYCSRAKVPEGPTTAGPMPEVSAKDVEVARAIIRDAEYCSPDFARRILALLEWAAGMKGGAR